jgi:hypothetical protein
MEYGTFAGEVDITNPVTVLEVLEYALDRFSTDRVDTTLTPEQLFGLLDMSHDTIRKLSLSVRNTLDGRGDLNTPA